ncbi:MAG: RagB/SusD family nutrient uptake outer membrane protein [Paludibacteraceae bacterium]|nr:RagB/SusD family nutrient uptake outer membrane protein [Paludibacteraceae bacterium]
MNLSNFKYKSLIYGLSALAFCTTSCKDFLDVDVYDQYSTESVKTYQDCLALTKPLYGGYVWSEYEGKFSWCVNEGIPGVLFNVHQEEGALFLLSIGDDNPILLEGYRSLYSGVIASCNQIIDKVSGLETSAALTEAEKNQILGEARLFRGYAHFLATEYFGETPLVLHNAKDIADNVALPRVSRKTLYTAIESDFKFAAENLPDSPTDNWRASKYSAKAMLAKLYLTMGSCVADLPGGTYPFKVSPSESAAYMSEVVKLTTEVIDKKGGTASLDSHANIFSAAGRTEPSKETVFALYWKLADYGEGSMYQAQMAPEDIWSPKSGWGSGKGIAYTLYHSFDKNDPRLYELCLVADHEYETAKGVKVYYGPNYGSYNPKTDHVKSGSEFLSSGQCVLNNIKKYIWGVDATAIQDKGMAYDRRMDIVRLSDVYMMRAEANMALENIDVLAKVSSGVADINAVLVAHGAAPISESIPYFENISRPQESDVIFNVKVDDGAPQPITVHVDHPMYHDTKRADFVQQRRKEFAMECQAWLDLKRFFYRNPEWAGQFMYQMDRGIQFSKNPEVQDESMFQTESGYSRRQLVHDLNVKLSEMFPNGDYNAGESEPIVSVDNFINKKYWYLPIPSSAKAYLSTTVLDVPDQVLNQTYPY